MKMWKYLNQKTHSRPKGVALVMAMIFMLLGVLIIIPLSNFMASGLKTSVFYNNKADSLYAADAGIQDATYRVKYNHFSNLSPVYNTYDYDTTWEYHFSDSDKTVNDRDVEITIQNLWMPDMAKPHKTDIPSAKSIILAEKLVVTGSADVVAKVYSIKITYDKAATDQPLLISSIGIWLPPGFHYDTSRKGSLDVDVSSDYYSRPKGHDGSYDLDNDEPYYGNSQAVHWDFSNYPFAGDASHDPLPGVSVTDSPMTAQINIPFYPDTPASSPPVPEDKPSATAWITTSGVSDIPYSWNADVKVFRITSTALADPNDPDSGTMVESFIAKNELRDLGSAISGDYYATGNTLIRDANTDSGHIRDTWLNPADHSSSSTISTISDKADVAAAYLYWTAWERDNFLDLCSSLTNWHTGASNSWSVYNSSRFRGQYSSGKARNIYLNNAVDITSSSEAYISWDQYVSTPSAGDVFTDVCSNFNNWNNGNCWTISSNKFKGQYVSSPTRDLSSKNSINMSGYAGVGGTITISWDQSKNGTFSSSDGFDVYYATTAGAPGSSDWTLMHSFRGSEISASSNSCVTPLITIPGNLWFKFSVVGTNTGIYFTLDNINVRITPQYVSTDSLTLSISKNGGATYTDITTFHADDTADVDTTSRTVSVDLPSDYLNDPTLNNFKMQFTLNGFNGDNEYYNLDNIKITAVQPNKFNSVSFKIDGHQVYFDGDGEPQKDGTTKLTADKTDTIINATSGTKGYSYSCYKDVTALVTTFSQKAPDPETNHPGNGTYTVANVDASLGVDGNDSYGDQLAHAGWSLIIIYSSPDTVGHQLYLYDRFSFADDDTTSNPVRGDLDFDKNGHPGGDISGFIVPNRTKDKNGNWETNAATITCFVGEGDNWITGDFIALNAPGQYWDDNVTNYPPSAIPNSYKLWDNEGSAQSNTQSAPNNVWNSLSQVCTADGVDVDSFSIPWDSNNNGILDTGDMIHEGDTSAHIDLYTNSDNWNLVYIILSFRSNITMGGALSYLIHE
jgi:hypothetical protein